MGARKVHYKGMMLILESWMLTLNPWKLSLELLRHHNGLWRLSLLL
jgi:hypothetical protein